MVASGSNDRTVVIWDLGGNLKLDSHISDARSLLFSMAAKAVDLPLEFTCPITHELMKDPVYAEGMLQAMDHQPMLGRNCLNVCLSPLPDGFTYERAAIQEWFARDHPTVSPMTNLELSTAELVENGKLKQRIEEYLRTLDPQQHPV